jgi:peptidoglycan/LPS O-acetylase OafA/YrhL
MPINIPGSFLTFIISIWILTYVVINAENKTLKFRFILHNPILLFIGKISYGMYLYHFIISSLLNTNLINKYINPHLPDFLLKIILSGFFSLKIFSCLFILLSYNFFEKRFLR